MASSSSATPPLKGVTRYPPAGESANELWMERSNLDGAVLTGVAYGVHAIIFFMCFQLLWKQRQAHPRRSLFYLCYICLHFICGTLGFAMGTLFNEMTFIDNRDYPGGPNAFAVEQFSHWSNYITFVVYIVAFWLQDWLLLYRFSVIWGSKWYTIVVPAMLYVTSMIIACLLLAEIRTPGNDIWQSLNVDFFTVFWILEILTNLILTSLIVGRLLLMRRKLRVIMGSQQRSPYLSISAMLVESVLLFSAFGLLYLVPYLLNKNLQNLVLNPAGQIGSISPLLIVMRVAQGQALTKEKMVDTTTLAAGSSSGRSMRLRPLRFHRGADTSLATGIAATSVMRPGASDYELDQDFIKVEVA